MSDVIDIKTRKKIDRLDIEDGTSVSTFLNILKKKCREEKYTSLFVITVSEDNHCDWGFVGKNEHQKALAYMVLDELQLDLKYAVFPQVEIELDDDE